MADGSARRRVLVLGARSPQAWIEALAPHLPDRRIEPFDPDGDGHAAYVLIGRPAPGEVARLRGLELALSLNAGIEHLLAEPALPPKLPLVRMVDPGLTAGMTAWVTAHVLAFTLRLADYRRQQARALWAPLEQLPPGASPVAILGAGALGRAAAASLAAHGFPVRAWSRTGGSIPGASSHAGEAGLVEAVSDAVILVNLLPLTPATAGILEAGLFARLAGGSLLINAARGGHLNEADLLHALARGRPSAAVLDVFAQEPLGADHPFWGHEQVTVSPHVASLTHPGTAAPVIAAAIRDHEAGRRPAHLVDRASGY